MLFYIVSILCLCSQFGTDASPVHKLREQINNPTPHPMTHPSPVAQLDPTQSLQPNKDSIKDKYPLGFAQKTICYDVPESDVVSITPKTMFNGLGWPLTAPPNCGGNTRQVTFNDRFPVDSRDVHPHAKVATYWGLTADQIADAKITKSYSGLKPYLPNGKLLKIALWSPGGENIDLQYAAVLNKIAATHGWLVSSVEFPVGDGFWRFDSVPHQWNQNGLLFQYRVKDFKKNIERLRAANADPTHPYYQKLDLDHIRFFGHSDGGVAALAAYVGLPFGPLYVDPLTDSGIKGTLSTMDMGLWAYPDSNLTAVANNIMFAGLWSQNSMDSQGFWRLHDANQNLYLNNHLIIEHIIHDVFQLNSCDLSKLINYTTAAFYVAYPGISDQAWCLIPPFDKYVGPMLPKPPLQDVANTIFEWYDRQLTTIETNSLMVYAAQFSTVAIESWQATLPISTIHYGRWHCGNFTNPDGVEFALELARGEKGYSYSADAYFSYVSQLDYVDDPNPQVWAYPHPEWDGSGRSAFTIVQPRYLQDLVPNLYCGCAFNPLC